MVRSAAVAGRCVDHRYYRLRNLVCSDVLSELELRRSELGVCVCCGRLCPRVHHACLLFILYSLVTRVLPPPPPPPPPPGTVDYGTVGHYKL